MMLKRGSWVMVSRNATYAYRDLRGQMGVIVTAPVFSDKYTVSFSTADGAGLTRRIPRRFLDEYAAPRTGVFS